MGNTHRYTDLADYCERNPQLVEKWIAASVGIDPARFSKLKSRKYGLRPTDAEAAAIAGLLGRGESYVHKLYTRRAA
jgi:hypothetical protein